MSCGDAAPEQTSEDATPSPGSGGKADGVVSVDACEAAFDAFETCPPFESDLSLSAEAQERLWAEADRCREEESIQVGYHDQCCDLTTLEDTTFCQAHAQRLDEGYALLCESFIETYQECALTSFFSLGGCQRAFFAADADGDCCERAPSELCKNPREAPPIPDSNAFTRALIEANGVFYNTPLFQQIQPIDVLPTTLQQNLPLYGNPVATNVLDVGDFDIDLDAPNAAEQLEEASRAFTQYTITERLPIQYAIAGYGGRVYEPVSLADAYITFWRTEGGRTVLATHFFDWAQAAHLNFGWVHGFTFVLGESACTYLGEALNDPALGDITYLLDEANGRAGATCRPEIFQPLDTDSPQIEDLKASIIGYLFNGDYDDTRINTVEAAYSISSSKFTGTLLEMVEVRTARNDEILGDASEFPLSTLRILLNVDGQIVHVYDDDACESELSAALPCDVPF